MNDEGSKQMKSLVFYFSLEKATDLAQGVNLGYKTKKRFSPKRTTDKGNEQYSAVLTGLYNLNNFLPNAKLRTGRSGALG